MTTINTIEAVVDKRAHKKPHQYTIAEILLCRYIGKIVAFPKLTMNAADNDIKPVQRVASSRQPQQPSPASPSCSQPPILAPSR